MSTLQTPLTQPLSALPMPHKALTVSWKVSECKPQEYNIRPSFLGGDMFGLAAGAYTRPLLSST